MHSLRLISDVMWAASALLEFAVVALILRSKSPFPFPFFLTYVAVDGCVGAILLVLGKIPWVPGPFWWRVYIAGIGIATALRFCVIYEVFEHVFRTHAALNRIGRTVFRVALLVFFLGGIGIAALTHSNEVYKAMAILHLLQETASILQVGLLSSLFIFTIFLGLRWRNFAFGIALGLDVYAAANLAAAAIKAHLGLSGSMLLNIATLGVYNLCGLIWIFYLVAPERSLSRSIPKLPDHDLDLWNKELQRLTQQ